MYQKSLYLEAKLNSFLKNPFGIASAERNAKIPFLNICLLPKNFNELSIEDFYNESYFENLIKMINQQENLLEGVPAGTFSLPFKSITRTPHSIIFRDVSNGIRSGNRTLELFYNGAARIKIPIYYTTIKTPLNQTDSDNLYINLLYQHLGENLSQCKLVDISAMFFCIRYTIKKYSRFLNDNISSHANTFAMVEMENIFQLIPFVESESFTDHLTKYHLPISTYEYKKIPDELSSRRWIEFEKLDSVEFEIFDIFKMGLGLPPNTKIFSDSLGLFIEKCGGSVESPLK